MAQPHDLGAEAVHTREHGSIGRGGRDVGAKGIFKQYTAGGETIQMGGGEALVAVAAHMVSAERIDSDQQNVRVFRQGFLSKTKISVGPIIVM